MEDLSPSSFFDLSLYEHKELFSKSAFVWDALPKISSYLNAFPFGEIRTKVPVTAYLINPETIFIGEGTEVEPGAFIRGPCIIGRNCVVRHGAYIRGSFIAGNHCVIGHDTEIKNSVFLDHAHAAHFAYVGDSILGSNANLGAGAKCANLRLDGKEVVVQGREKKIGSGLRKFGAIVGDHVQLGCNVVTNPGTLIGKNCIALPGTCFGGTIPPDHVIKPESSFCVSPLEAKKGALQEKA